MRDISDDDLIGEMTRRLRENQNAFRDLLVVTKKNQQVNEKLKHAEALKSNFLSNIRNEINNPLSVILGMSKQLTCNASDQQTILLLAETIYREAFELDFQLKNIFSAAELEAGEPSLSISLVNGEALIRDLLDSFQQRAAAKKIELRFAIDSSDHAAGLFCNTDPEKLSCILSNLLANAVEYSQEGATVRIAATTEGGQVRVSVADEGAGVPEEDRESIFDRFRQLDHGTKKRHRGHGLGLSVAKALSELLDGTLTLSCPPNGGCVFTLTVPDAGKGRSHDLSEQSNVYLFDEVKKF